MDDREREGWGRWRRWMSMRYLLSSPPHPEGTVYVAIDSHYCLEKENKYSTSDRRKTPIRSIFLILVLHPSQKCRWFVLYTCNTCFCFFRLSSPITLVAHPSIHHLSIRLCKSCSTTVLCVLMLTMSLTA